MPVELTTTSVAAGGDMVARDDDGKVTFVSGALPGERVRVDITDERGDYNRAVAVEILDAAPGRTTPPCPHVTRGCGGCSWQHIDVATQRDLKVQIITEALQRIGGIGVPEVHLGPALATDGFRTTIRLAAGTGFRHARSHDIVEVDSCLVAHPRITELLGIDFGRAKEVTIRCGSRTGDRLVMTDPARIRLALPDDVHVGPHAFIHEEVAGLRLKISAGSFFQSRPDGADVLIDLVRAASHDAPSGRMVDAYGGVGLFTAALERDSTIIEWSKSSMHDARENVPHAKVIAADVAKWRPSTASLVVADPPRAGLGRDAVKVLAATRATRFVLVSCDPASLGRDAKLLAAEGYTHDGTTLVDLFPHTPHIEAVSRFVR